MPSHRESGMQGFTEGVEAKTACLKLRGFESGFCLSTRIGAVRPLKPDIINQQGVVHVIFSALA